MQCEVLHQRRPTWLLGESDETRTDRRRRMSVSDGVDGRYPGDYPGRVISVRRVRDVAQGRLPTLRNMASQEWGVIVLDLSEAERAALSSRIMKVASSEMNVAAVTFDDRWGAAAGAIDAAFGTREAAEAAELKADDVFDFDGRRFTEASGFASGNLAETITHSGTGLYSVKVTPTKNDDTQSGAPAGQVITLVTGGLGTDAFIGGYVLNVTRSETRAIVSHTAGTITLEGSLASWVDTDDLDIFDSWSTIQAALDQLFTDQGATTFTASQYIRIFAGTYDENVIANVALNTGVTAGALLIIEGDPADDRADIHLAPTAGQPLVLSFEFEVLVRHMKITRADSGNCITTSILMDTTELHDCDITAVTVGVTGNLGRGYRIKNCQITTTGSSGFAIGVISGASIINCTLVSSGTGQSGLTTITGGFVCDGCTFTGFASAMTSTITPNAVFHNCTIYDCGVAFSYRSFSSECRVVNCTIENVNSVFGGGVGVFPEETSTSIGADVILRNNIYFNYTNFADLGSTKTYAEFIALDRVDAAGDLDATDPLMTDPANDDFSLQALSPARHAGHGSGVITGSNGVAFDPYHPDIGAWSSGVLPASTLNISAIAPNFDGDSFDMTVANTLGRTVNVYTSPDIPATFTLEPTTRVGDGDLTITGKTAGVLYYVYAVTLIGNTIAGVSNIVSVLITTTDSGGLPASVDEDPSVLPGVDLLLRDETHDLARDSRDIVLVDGSLLVRQRLSIALQLFKGEWFLDADAGVPWLQEILEKGVAVAVIDAILRDKIIATPGVNRILTYSSEIDAATRTVSVAFTVDTVYGPVEFEGALI